VPTGDNTTATVKKQLFRQVLSPATREQAIVEEMFSVRSVPGLKIGISSSVESVTGRDLKAPISVLTYSVALVQYNIIM
jgi:hypothetical protein